MEYKTFNHSHLFEQFRGDEEILLEVITIFLEGHQEVVRGLREAIDERDAEKLRINAHTLKGVLGNFYAVDGARTAYELEKSASDPDYQKSQALFKSLEDFLKVFLTELEILKKSL